MKSSTNAPSVLDLGGDPDALRALREDAARDPHAVLGAHPARIDGQRGLVIRSFHPDAVRCSIQLGVYVRPMALLGGGVFAAFWPGAALPCAYRLIFGFSDGSSWERDDPYRFSPTLGALDLHLIGEGTHRRLWTVLGARVCTMDGVLGAAFAVWAPNARRVSVVGDFNAWDGRLFPMRSLGASGVWELFIPEVSAGALYKYEIKTQHGELRLKADPCARECEASPGTASRVTSSTFEWHDEPWLERRASFAAARSPVAIYEVHLGSWARVPEEHDRMLTYREISRPLVAHVKRLGFTHIELLPVAEHAYYPSWGYQITGYYAPTSRYGTPDDFRFFVDYCHEHGIGVLIDWVPAHFPKDDFALRRFDGSALYEHEDPRRGEQPDWGTLIFNLGRNEVRNFLTANALYWLEEFHIDGLRFDAVASMLYLDYSRKPGEWLANAFGGRENLSAIAFLREVNGLVHELVPGAFTVAEESTSWPGVTRSPGAGGLGFDFKWNMGWMHDTLAFFEHEPVHRKHHLGALTFAMVYEYSERFVNAISHDEVVYGKRSLLEKMPGDAWQKFANVRLLFGYQYTRPGKQLLFMGAEFGQQKEWNFDASLDFHLELEPAHAGLERYLSELSQLYRRTPALYQGDPDPEGFEWVDCGDSENTVLSYLRKSATQVVLVVLNFTPVPRYGYRVGVPAAANFRTLLASDEPRFGGSGVSPSTSFASESVPLHGRAQSIRVTLPPLGIVIIAADPADSSRAGRSSVVSGDP